MRRTKLQTRKNTDHLYIPDTQVSIGTPTDHIVWLGKYIWDNKPAKIKFAGDWFDMASLCKYTKGQLSSLAGRTKQDIEAGKAAMKLLFDTIEACREQAIKDHAPHSYKPQLDFYFGNHEYRLMRYVEEHPELEDLFGYHTFGLEEFGIKIWKFLDHHVDDGILYSHYVTSVNSTTTINRANMILNKYHISAVVGHTPGLDWALSSIAPTGKLIQAIVAGSFYLHNEDYRSRVCNSHWRGIVHLYDVKDGVFDPHFVSMAALKKLYGE